MVASFSFLFNYYIVYVHRILLHYSTPSQLSWYLFKTRIFLHKIKEIGYQKKRFDVVDSDQLTHGRLFNYYTVYVHRILLLHSFVSIETVETKECMNILCRIIKQVVMNRFCCVSAMWSSSKELSWGETDYSWPSLTKSWSWNMHSYHLATTVARPLSS